MALTQTTWNAVVKKKFRETSEFKQLDAAVSAYLLLGGKTDQNVANIKGAWDTWEHKFKIKNQTYKNSDRYTIGCALDDIDDLLKLAGSPQVVAVNTGVSSQIPRSNIEVIRQRDQLTPELRPEGTKYVKTSSGKWEPKIFSQQLSNSCTCACATTFLNKLISQPVREDVFIDKYNSVNTVRHNFEVDGTFFPPIHKTLVEAFHADAQLHTTPSWDALRSILKGASRDVPVLLGVQWLNNNIPGGGHAVICTGRGPIPGWNGLEGSQGGFLIEDPWGQHTDPGLQLDGTYYVKDGASGNWSQGIAQFAWGCITGKISPREYGKYGSYAKVGVKLL